MHNREWGARNMIQRRLGLCGTLAAIVSATMAWAQTGIAQSPDIAGLKRSKVCFIGSTKATVGGAGNVAGHSTIRMSNDGGWCWLSLWATHGSVAYVATFRLAEPPSHGEVLMGEVNKRARVAYKPAPGFTGEDTYTIVDTMTARSGLYRSR
jgi:hypothetical protein